MRVLLFSAAPKADAAGVQRVVIDLAAHLRDRGHVVATAWPDGDGTAQDWRLPLEAGVGARGRPGARQVAGALHDGARLARRLRRFRPDVVNLHYPRGQTLYFDALQRVLGYRMVLSFHNSDLFDASPAVRARLPGWIARAAAVTAVSEELACALALVAPAPRALVIPNGVDAAFWAPPPGGARDPNLVVAAGRLIGMKGFDLLLRAFADLGSGDARLVIAGEGPDRDALARDAAALGLGARVAFPGRLDADGLRRLFHRAGVFAMPSRREGMPLVLLEAMAAGLPAVAARVSGVAQVMTPEAGAPGTGEIVPPEDVAALAEALARRVGDGARTRREGDAARARVAARFDRTRAYGAYEDVLSAASFGGQ